MIEERREAHIVEIVLVAELIEVRRLVHAVLRAEQTEVRRVAHRVVTV